VVKPVIDPDAPIPETQCVIQNFSHRELDFEAPEAERVDGPETQSFLALQIASAKKPKRPKKSVFDQIMEEGPSKKEDPIYPLSEQMVAYAEVDVNQPSPSELRRKSDKPKNRYIFGITGISDTVRGNFTSFHEIE
jgi:hypothetical protein